MLAAGVTLCVAGGSAVAFGFAAGLGPLNSKPFGSWSKTPLIEAPIVASCDNFDGSDGPLSGRAVSSTFRCGSQTWTVHDGLWSAAAGSVATDGTPDSTATLPAGLTDATAAVDIAGTDTASERGGVVIDHDGDHTYLAAVEVGDATSHVDLVLMAAGVPTVLATADVVIPPANHLALTRSGTVVTVHIDGVAAIMYSLVPGDIATLAAGTRAGLYASSASVQFDNLLVTTPSPG
ncbi:MAG: hypothetical protein JWN99_2589 [Ilumatobacteraceae bacterium]|nr:hypothetical protein [Ilumatobacteraceae bacterium]